MEFSLKNSRYRKLLWDDCFLMPGIPQSNSFEFQQPLNLLSFALDLGELKYSKPLFSSHKLQRTRQNYEIGRCMIIGDYELWMSAPSNFQLIATLDLLFSRMTIQLGMRVGQGSLKLSLHNNLHKMNKTSIVPKE